MIIFIFLRTPMPKIYRYRIIRLHAPRLHRRRIACDPRQLLLPLGKILPAAYRMAHALPRSVANKATKVLRSIIARLRAPRSFGWASTTPASIGPYGVSPQVFAQNFARLFLGSYSKLPNSTPPLN